MLQAAGIDGERLASYDRPIVSEPRVSVEQAPGLLRALEAYHITLKVRKGKYCRLKHWPSTSGQGFELCG